MNYRDGEFLKPFADYAMRGDGHVFGCVTNEIGGLLKRFVEIDTKHDELLRFGIQAVITARTQPLHIITGFLRI